MCRVFDLSGVAWSRERNQEVSKNRVVVLDHGTEFSESVYKILPSSFFTFSHSSHRLDRLFRSLKSNDDRSVMYKRLEEFDGTIAVPINVGLKSSHWTLATVSGRGPDLRVTYVDPLSGKPDRHARKAIELVRPDLLVRKAHLKWRTG